ncbi:hypothetical protein [Streptomyces sp. NPDC005438]|uniref:hypothetical protein n=1 Tax=Streptomyces sp. NPDC005438 TaxID=3156880 RepID=UPI0033AAF66E
MRFRTVLRSSSALWASPVVLALVVLYLYVVFTEDYAHSRGPIDYAPTVVSLVLNPASAIAYAAASALAAWEAGRLTRGQVFLLAPARSRFTVALQVLVPVVGLAWLTVLTPVVVGLVREGLGFPLDALPLVVMPLGVCCAHAVLGFAVGLRVPRLVAAPVLAVGVFYVVVASASSGETMWPRHLAGQYFGVVGFGSALPWGSVAPHLLFAGSLATGVLLLWVTPGHRRLRPLVLALAVAVGVTGTLAAYHQVRDWGPTAPEVAAPVDWSCVNSAPRVCVPSAGRADPRRAQAEVMAPLARLRAAGVRTPEPVSVLDSVAEHRSAGTATRWRLPLTSSQRAGTTSYQALRRVNELPCAEPRDELAARSTGLWAARVTGLEKPYLREQRRELGRTDGGDRLVRTARRTVDVVRAKSARAQSAWYHQQRERACTRSSTGEDD